MYESFFGLKQAPFSIAPDPRYLYMSERHREALAHLLYGLGGAGGFVLLSGEIGAGKTTVCRCFLEQVPASCHVAYIFNPALTVLELLQSVCAEFRIPVQPALPQAPTVKDHLEPLNRFLLEAHGAGHQCVLVIDEAQNLSADVLEQLRLLTNLETAERKLLQIILIGQPELRDLVARPELEQLAQRVIARFHLGALGEGETARYLAHRLGVAGRRGALPFDRKALRRIFQLSGGVPRRINLLADRALLGAFGQGRAVVGAEVVNKAASEVFDLRRTAVGAAREGRRGTSAHASDAADAPDRRRRNGRAAVAPWVWALGGGVVALGLVGLGALIGLGAGKGTGWGASAGAPTEAAVAASGAASAGAPRGSAAGALGMVGTASMAGTAAVNGITGNAGAAVDAAPSASASAAAGLPAPTASRPALPARVPVSALPRFDPARDWAALDAGREPAWRELAGQWVLALAPGDPCQIAARQQLACFRSGSGTLAQLRQLDRPVVLKLVDAQRRSGRALLLGLGSDLARIAVGERQWALPLPLLAQLWQGEYGTLWRMPVGYTQPLAPGMTGTAMPALVAALAVQAGDPPPEPGQATEAPGVRERLLAFQRANGLPADGVAGPATLMMLNRAVGVIEPRLAVE